MSEKSKNKKNEEKKVSENSSDSLPDTEIIDEAVNDKVVDEESLQDQFVRLQADFANFRNRTQRERLELYQRANQDLFLEILPVLDHFELGLETAKAQDTDEAVIEGFSLVLEQFKAVLDQFKVQSIKAVGEKFDPHLHEALTHLPSDDYDEGICINEVRKGYLMGDKLIRASQVVVASGPTEKGEKVDGK